MLFLAGEDEGRVGGYVEAAALGGAEALGVEDAVAGYDLSVIHS